MTTFTYGQLRREVSLSADLEDEDFIKPDEMVQYFNDSIDEIEADIHDTYQDYFLTYESLNFVANTAEYSLPSKIFAQKIRAIMYHNGVDIYKIQQVRELYKFEQIEHLLEYGSGSEKKQYIIRNDSTTAGYKLLFVPTPTGNETATVKIWYLRNANRVPLTTGSGNSQAASDAIVIDIPEFTQLIKQSVLVRIYEKEKDDRLELAIARKEQLRKNMIRTLKDRIPDGDNLMQQDMSYYIDMS